MNSERGSGRASRSGQGKPVMAALRLQGRVRALVGIVGLAGVGISLAYVAVVAFVRLIG